jgi:hypothetical protein
VLRQQPAATLRDIIRRFKKKSGHSWNLFASKVRRWRGCESACAPRCALWC